MIRIFILIFPIWIVSCSSFSSKNKIKENSFSKSFSSLAPEQQKIYLDNPLDFLSWTFKESRESFLDPKTSLNAEWPKIRLHGDLRADDVLLLPKNSTQRFQFLYRLENTFENYLIWDLYTLSVSSEFIANYLRLGDVSAEKCILSYSGGLKAQLDNKGSAYPTPTSGDAWIPLDTLNRESPTPLDPAIQDSLSKKFNHQWMIVNSAPNFRDPQLRPTRIMIDEKNDIWRFAALSSTDKCSDLGKSVTQYSSGGNKHCVKILNQGYFLLERFPSGTQQLSLMTMQNSEELSRLQNDFCRYIAKGHASALSKAEIRKIYFLMSKHPAWASRFADDVKRHAQNALDAYRLSLKNLN